MLASADGNYEPRRIFALPAAERTLSCCARRFFLDSLIG